MIELTVTGRVAVVTIRRPEARNCIDPEAALGIEHALDQLDEDPSLWVGVLAGEGPVFSAGADLHAIAAGQASGLSTSRGGFGGLVRRERVKPLIAAVDGPALAGGFELALACDLIVASRQAVFGLPEVRRSLVASAGGLFRLPQSLGLKVAQEMILTGDTITAERAYQLGLVNRLTEPGQALLGATELAERIAANAPVAVWESRRVAADAFGRDEEDLWAETAEAASRVARSYDFAEGPRAFVERRDPQWRGR